MSTYLVLALANGYAAKFDRAIITFSTRAIMTFLLEQINLLLTTSPGNLVYHLVLAFALMAGLQAAVIQRGLDNQTAVRRLIIGFCILLIGQAVLFISSALAWQRVIDPQQFLPVIDRVVIAISILWLAWMWATPQPHQIADAAIIVLTLVLLLFGGISISLWVPQVGLSNFNRSAIDQGWAIIDLLILLAAIAGILYQRKANWPLGLGFFTILLIGVAAHLFWAESRQDYAAAIRLAQVCVYPLLPSLARNLAAKDTLTGTERTAGEKEPATLPGRKRRVLDPAVVRSWLEVAYLDTPQQVCPALIQAVGRSLVADLCFLIVAPDRQSAFLQCGYDLIRQETMPGSAIDQNRIPHLTNALHRGRAIRIPSERKDLVADLSALAASLGLKNTGDVLAAPLTLPNVAWAGIIAVSPYTNYEWTSEDQAVLTMIAEQAAPLLAPLFAPAETPPVSSPARQVYDYSPSEIEQIIEERKLLLAEIDALRQEARLTPQNLDVEALLAVQEDSRATIQRLEADNMELREALHSIRSDPELLQRNETLQGELQTALEELARVQNLLADANYQVLNLQNRLLTPGIGGGKSSDTLLNIVQDLRQPVYSILGYIDLLMEESRALIGSEQEKYLERIKSSSERMKSILDTYNLSPFESSPVELAPQDVDFSSELEQVLASLGEQLHEKKITLEKDINDNLPLVYGDREALHQILLHLMQNAGNVTPQEGCIKVAVNMDDARKETPFLVFRVTDQGGGIPQEQLNKVFSRSSRDDRGLIPGVSDSGLGLSIAKTLVEAHGGRIWVESNPGKTTTFSLILPLRSTVTNGYPKAT